MSSDNFNRANETPLASPWTTQTGASFGMRLDTNEVRPDPAGDPSASYHSDTPADNQFSEVVLSTLETSTAEIHYGIGPAVRMATGDTRKYTGVARSGQLLIVEWDNALGFTQLGSTFSGTVSVGDVIRLEAEGTTIRLKQNGTERISVTDATLTSGRYGIAGTVSNVAATAVDDWVGGDITGTKPMFRGQS